MNSQFEVVLIFDKNNSISRKFDNASFGRGCLSNLWEIKRAKPSKNHGATFPEELVDKILVNFCKPGQTVVDPFMGSGTTGVSCAKNGFNFFGIELLQKYFDMSKERILDVSK